MPQTLNLVTLCTDIELICGFVDTKYRDLIKRAVYWGMEEFSNVQNWAYYDSKGTITLVAPYETGTVTATENSKTVTGAGTAWTSAMVGRKIRIAGENAYYEIAAVGGVGTITLKEPYGGETQSAATYSIYKDEYRLAANLNKLKVMCQVEDNNPIIGLPSEIFDLLYAAPTAEGSPKYCILRGRQDDTYTTGTLSGSQGSATLTGVGTAWTSVDGLGRGSRILIGNVTYVVKSVDSDTQITLFENLTAAASTSTYTIYLDNFIIQFYTIPDDIESIPYRYQRMPDIIWENNQIPDMPYAAQHLLVDAGVARAWEVKDKTEAKNKKDEFFKLLQKAKNDLSTVNEMAVYQRSTIDNRGFDEVGAQLPSGYGYPLRGLRA